jgi:hypothetical protein
MFRGMKSLFGKTRLGRTRFGRTALFPAPLFLALVFLSQVFLAQFSLAQTSAPSQAQARRLILKDGSYQSVTKYEVHGERVRYFSAERGEWEEVPKSLIDWDATEKFEQGRQQEKLAPEALELDKELEAQRKADLARSPQVAPGLRLPDDGGIFLLDTFENQPQLAELQQSGGEVGVRAKSNVLRQAVNPLAGAKQTIELPGAHARIQSHTAVPSLYINIDSNTGASPDNKDPGAPPPLAPSNNDRFKIVRIEVKGGKRVLGSVKVAVTGQPKTDERLVAATVTAMTGGWVKLTPAEPLAPGEYAVVEMMGKDAMNLYVWDFGVNPAAPANPSAWKPEPPETQPKSGQPQDLKKRETP